MKTTENTENPERDRHSLTYSVIGAAIEVHRYLGPGLLESTYEKCLARELKLQKIAFETQVLIPLEYKGIKLDCGYRVDLIIEDSIVVELKVVERPLGIHQAQILTYMKLAKIPLGLLINFNSAPLSTGIQRFAI